MFYSTKCTSVFFYWCILSFLFIASSVFSQSLKEYEQQLQAIAPKMLSDSTEELRYEAHTAFQEVWELILDDPKSIKYNFDSLTTFPILDSKDGKLRIINWMVPKDNGTSEYFAIAQYFDSGKRYKVDYLEAITSEIRQPESYVTKDKEWIGALYYQISSFKRGKRTYYLLMGWDGNDDKSNRKIAEVVSISSKLRFGAPVFRKGKKKMQRFILQYNKEASVSMKYYPKEERILFSHLIPINPNFEGLYDYYVSDGGQDEFVLKNGVFHYKSNAEITQKVDVPNRKKLRRGLLPR